MPDWIILTVARGRYRRCVRAEHVAAFCRLSDDYPPFALDEAKSLVWFSIATDPLQITETVEDIAGQLGAPVP